ncbi:MAG: tetratricopeptide repeat protein [Bacteroidia bacterium]
MRKACLLFCTTLFVHSFIFAQRPPQLDSILNASAKYTDIVIFLRDNFSYKVLQQELEQEASDKNKTKICNALCWQYFNSNPQKALDYANSQIQLAEKLNDRDALESGYDNFGFLYSHFGEHEKALSYLLKSLKIKEGKKDSAGIAVCMNGIGTIYFTMRNFPQALEYMFKTLKMDSLGGNKSNVAEHYSNIGACYAEMGRDTTALKYYLKCEKLSKELGLQQSSTNLCNVGVAYMKVGEIEKANDYLIRALTLAEKEKDQATIIVIKIALGDLSISRKEYAVALKYNEEALSLAKLNKLIEYEIQALKSMANIYSKQGKFEKAYECNRLFSDLKDTLINEENGRIITEMNTKYETEKKEKQLQIQDLTLNQNKLELKKRQIIIYATAGGIVLLIALSFFIFRGYKQKKEANIELTEKNMIIEEKSRIVEEQHKDIIDSINYAKRIQQAILAEEEHISDHLPPHFILFKPKDIVSGDFYWAFEKGDYLYVTAADCTGHGVPGAFLTMLGISYLNEINSKEEILTPAEILDQLRDKILKELSRHGTTKDGMDISLIRMNLKTHEVMWAGAFNPLWYTDNGVLKEIKANKQPIGYAENLLPFTNHTLNLSAKDTVYLFTDGFADQFGGPGGKKYKYKQMEQVLMANRNKTFEEQKNILKRSFEDWKGNLEQVDDVTVIAIQIAAN